MTQLESALHVFEATPDPSSTKSYKVRRPHTKTRSGCITCKTRRVKCDEAKPICHNCYRRSIRCQYKPSTSTSRCTPSTASSSSTGGSTSSLTLTWPSQPTTPPILSSASSSASNEYTFTTPLDLSILAYFTNVVAPAIFGRSAFAFDPTFSHSAEAAGLRLLGIGLSNAHVMHSLLAASAMHLRANKGWMGGMEYGVERGHWVCASEGYRRELDTLIPSVGGEGEGEGVGMDGGGKRDLIKTDALLTSCMLLNLLSWADVPDVKTDWERRKRWPFVKRKTKDGRSPLQWLRVQMGMAALLRGLWACRKEKEESMWMELFQKMGHEELYDDRSGTAGLEIEWCEMFEIDEESDVKSHPYLKLVRRVVVLRKCWEETERRIAEGEDLTHDDRAMRYSQYMEAVDARVMERLEEGDVRTLVLFAHCLSISCNVSEWWCRKRVVQECYNVVQYLHEMHGNEVDRGWLVFPASMCGYDLDRVQGIE